MFCCGNIDNNNESNNRRNSIIRPVSNINKKKNIPNDELGIMAVINNMKTDWHIINYNKYNTVEKLYSYFINYYNDPNIYIEHYDNVNIKKNALSHIIQKNPLRLFLRINTIDESN